MKIKHLLFLAFLLIGMASISYGQTNLVAGWDGNGITGAGSEASNFGWAANPGEFTVAGSGSNRYMDVSAASNPPHLLADQSTYTGRVLLLRWDGVGATTQATIFSYMIPTALQANTEYKLSMLMEWWNNGSAPLVTVKIASDREGTNVVATRDIQTSSTRNLLEAQELTFTPTTAGTYYITFQANTLSLIGIANMSLVATTTTGVKNELNSASGYSMYPNPISRESGLYLTERGASNEAVQLYIYASSGKLQKSARVTPSASSRIDISDLVPGLYIAKVVTKKGTFNKTIVVQ